MSLLVLGIVETTQAAFNDVKSSNPYYQAIQYTQINNIVNGYPDGSFRAQTLVNRAEFTKILLGAVQMKVGNMRACFADVRQEWFAKFVCEAQNKGIIVGYSDGNFRPAAGINLAEAAKILVKTFKLKVVSSGGSTWFDDYLLTLTHMGVVPISFNTPEQGVRRGEMVEMIYRLRTGIKNLPTYDFQPIPQKTLHEMNLSRVDIPRLRQTWSKWYNDYRKSLGLKPYQYDLRLEDSALNWSGTMLQRGVVSHRRFVNSAYYDYAEITAWFKARGLVFENIKRATHTENIAYGSYICGVNITDCTDILLTSVRRTFDFYLNEKGQSYDAHYRSIIKPEFRIMGLGVVIKNGKFYLTVHFGTRIL